MADKQILHIHLQSNRVVDLEVSPNMMISDVKQKLATYMAGVPPSQFNLIIGGKSLEAHSTVESCNIKPDDKIHVIVVLTA